MLGTLFSAGFLLHYKRCPTQHFYPRCYEHLTKLHFVVIGVVGGTFYFNCFLLPYKSLSVLMGSPNGLTPNIQAAFVLVSHCNDKGLTLVDRCWTLKLVDTFNSSSLMATTTFPALGFFLVNLKIVATSSHSHIILGTFKDCHIDL
jgi:hypothetical protein